MKTKAKPANVRCDTCPYWGAENLVNEDDSKIYGTCRVELPTESNAARRFKHGALTGVVANHGWTPTDYWCGRHPEMSLLAQVRQQPAAGTTISADGGAVEDK